MAAAKNLRIVEDAACAIGSRYRGRPIGGHGDLVCFSFHPRKVITTGEGGMITTSRADYADRLRLLRQHGMSVSDAARHAAQKVVIESYDFLGYNYRMTDIQAAIGVEQMKRLPEIVARRRQLASKYTKALRRHAWLRPPYIPDDADPNFQSYAVQVAPDAPMSRDDLMQRLLDKRIATRRGIMLAHTEPACADLNLPQLPRSEEASGRSLLLPLFPQMTDEQQQRVLSVLHELA
jgi:dTDP-4-amino-4,6-dideoxygalactose transaminase